MIRKTIHLAVIVCTLFSLFGMALASTPKKKAFRTQQDFEGGEPSGVSIDYLGNLSLAPATEVVYESGIPFLWAGVADRRGNIFVAGGNGGNVYKVAGGKGSTVFESGDLQIHAMAIDSKDSLFVASSPRGKVYKVSASGAKPASESIFFDPEEVYIWALAIDSQDNLYVATGEKGNIYKVDTKGGAAMFYESDEAHVRKLLFARNGDLIAGTANKGIVLRVDKTGKASVLYDSPLVEITCLHQDERGNIYAAATGESPPQRMAQPAQPRSSDDAAGAGSAEVDVDEISLLQPVVAAGVERGAKRGELYRIGPDGDVRLFQMLKSERIYSMAAGPSGSILLGAGDKGRLYSMNAEGEVALVDRYEESQITWLGPRSSGQTYLATSNPGKVYRVSDKPGAKGEFTFEVVDTGVLSRWGAIGWKSRRDANLDVQTRTGNTEDPDKTWSLWSKKYSVAAGQAIESPAARFIQARVTLRAAGGNASPVLEELTLSYLQKNVPPVIRQVRVHAPGEYYPGASENESVGSALSNGATNSKNGLPKASFGRKSYQKGYRAVSWIAQDENGDQLSYSVFYKGVSDKNWRQVSESSAGTVYSWDTELMPDGEYVIKVEAADDLSNPPAAVLQTERSSQPFTVDNTGPQVSALSVSRRGAETIIAFAVEDERSPLKSVEYGVNAEKWQLVYPVDGICDSRNERFEIRLDSKVAGENLVVIKARDEVGNLGYGKRTVKL